MPVICDACGKSFQVPSKLAKHFRSHSNDRPFKCRFNCGKSASHLRNLETHEKYACSLRNELENADNMLQRYKCSECRKCFKNALYLRRHQKRDHGENHLECDTCDKSFFTTGALQRHIAVCCKLHRRRQPQCDNCGKKYGNTGDFLLHLKFKHAYGAGRLSRPVCDECGKTVFHRQALQRHVFFNHRRAGNRKQRCNDCQKNFYNSASLAEHFCRAYSGQAEATASRPAVGKRNDFQCDDCGEIWSKKESLIRHFTVAHLYAPLPLPKGIANASTVGRRTKFQCSKCTRSYSSIGALRNHERSHVTTTPCQCCTRRFGNHVSLRRHERVCMQEHRERFSCSMCARSYANARLLRNHARSKHGDLTTFAVYQCDICGENFKDKIALSVHGSRLDHQSANASKVGERHAILQCPTCKKYYRSSGALQAHVKLVHGINRVTAEKFQCRWCDRTYSFNSLCTRHEQSHNSAPELLLPCSLCAKSFTDAHKLQQHTNRMHRDPKKNYQCDLCCKYWKRRSVFKQHKCVRYFNVKWTNFAFHCDFCDKKFFTKSVVTTHATIRSHVVSTQSLSAKTLIP